MSILDQGWPLYSTIKSIKPAYRHSDAGFDNYYFISKWFLDLVCYTTSCVFTYFHKFMSIFFLVLAYRLNIIENICFNNLFSGCHIIIIQISLTIHFLVFHPYKCSFSWICSFSDIRYILHFTVCFFMTTLTYS